MCGNLGHRYNVTPAGHGGERKTLEVGLVASLLAATTFTSVYSFKLISDGSRVVYHHAVIEIQCMSPFFTIYIYIYIGSLLSVFIFGKISVIMYTIHFQNG